MNNYWTNNFLKRKNYENFRCALVFHMSCWNCECGNVGLGSITASSGLCPCLSQWQGNSPSYSNPQPHFKPQLSLVTAPKCQELSSSEDVNDSDISWHFELKSKCKDCSSSPRPARSVLLCGSLMMILVELAVSEQQSNLTPLDFTKVHFFATFCLVCSEGSPRI